jgi:hypothetical protein
MPKMGLKAITAILLLGRHSSKRVNWTLVIALFSTLVTVALVAAYVFERLAD